MGGEGIATADAGPLIHLDELDALEVLDVFATLVVPDVVLREVVVHRPGFGLRAGMVGGSVDVDTMRTRFPHLQDGELSALAACRDRGIQTLLTDDLAARDAATVAGIVAVRPMRARCSNGVASATQLIDDRRACRAPLGRPTSLRGRTA